MSEFDPVEYDRAKAKREHRCTLPDAGSYSAPSGWRCPCGKAYRKMTETQLNESWKVYKRMPEADGENLL